MLALKRIRDPQKNINMARFIQRTKATQGPAAEFTSDVFDSEG